MNAQRALLLTLLAVSLVLTACDQTGIDDTLGPETESAADLALRDAASKGAPVSAGTPVVLTGFATPESAVYDPVADVYYVSNLADPFTLAPDGFISRIDPDASGNVSGDPGFAWITGLTSPTGMTLDGNLLYIVDRDGLYVFEIDRTTGNAAQVDFVALGGEGSFLNDVCVGLHGMVYVTDTGLDLVTGPTGADAIYRIRNGAVSVLVDDEAEEGPNGCLTNGANVLWTTFKTNRVYRTNPSGKQKMLAMLPTGGLDSIVRAGGTLFASSWNADPTDPPTGVIYAMSMGGSRIQPLLEGVFTPGDLGYDSLRDRVLVPNVFGNALTIIPIE